MAQIILDSNNNLIQGDFDNATLNNRTKLQTTTTNATTNVYVVPNGSSTSAGVSVSNNSSLTNASKIVMATNGSTDTQIISGINGTGTYLPMSFYTNNALAMQINASGQTSIGGSTVTDAHLLNIQGPTTTNNVGVVLNDTTNNRIWAIDNGANTLKFYDYTAAALRMSIDSAGYVGVNTVANSYGQFAIKFDATAVGNNGTGIGIYPTAATSGAKFMYFYSEVGGGLGTITRNGTAGSVLYNTTSDYRLKTDIKPIANALSIVDQLNPVSYTWTGTEQTDTGFIAHELQTVIPSIVTGEKDAVDEEGKPVYQVVDYSKLVATLTAAIKEQQAIINELKTRIEALESK